MQDTIGGVLILVGTVLVIVGIVVFYRPLPRLGLGTQTRGVLLGLAGAALVGVVGIWRSEADGHSEESELASAVELPRFTPSVAPPPTPEPVEAEPAEVVPVERGYADPDEAAAAAFEVSHGRFLAYAQRCEEAWGAVTKAVDTADPVRIHARAIAGANLCSDLSTEMRNVAYGGLSDQAAREIAARTDDCADSYRNRALSMRALASAVRGELRADQVSSAGELMAAARTDTTRCLYAYQVTARVMGFETPQLPEPG